LQTWNYWQYIVRSLLLPPYAYAYARALVKSRASFADWMMLSEEELSQAVTNEEEDSDGQPSVLSQLVASRQRIV
jgi:hypothetical protein